jgi:hypothetical protein
MAASIAAGVLELTLFNMFLRACSDWSDIPQDAGCTLLEGVLRKITFAVYTACAAAAYDSRAAASFHSACCGELTMISVSV